VPQPGVCEGKSSLSLLPFVNVDGSSPAAGKGVFTLKNYSRDSAGSRVKNTILGAGHKLPLTNAGGVWTVNYLANNFGCESATEFTVDVYHKPVAKFTTTPDKQTSKISPYFTTHNLSSIFDKSALRYLWDPGTGNISDQSTAFESQFTYPAQDDEYDMTLIATSSNACADTMIQTLVVGKGSSVRNYDNFPSNIFRIDGFGQVYCQGTIKSLEIFAPDGRLYWSYSGNKAGKITLPAAIPNGTYIFRTTLLADKLTQTGTGRFVLIR
jgi:hypothetical protein